MESMTYGSERWMPEDERTPRTTHRSLGWGWVVGLVLCALLVGAGAMWSWLRWGRVPPTASQVAVRLPTGDVAIVVDDPTNNVVIADEALFVLAEASGDEAQCRALHGHAFTVGTSVQPAMCILGEAAVLQRWNGQLIVAVPMEIAAIVHSATAAGHTITVLPVQWDEPQTADAPSMVEPVDQDE